MEPLLAIIAAALVAVSVVLNRLALRPLPPSVPPGASSTVSADEGEH